MGKAAQEERRHGTRVNIVRPASPTEMGFRLMRANAGISDIRELDERSPFGFVCQPEDIANAVLFLVSEEGRYITNRAISVSGGGF